MSTLPTPNEQNIIKRVPFVSAELGEIIAWHDHEGPSIDLKLAPEDTDQHFDVGFTPRGNPQAGRRAARHGEHRAARWLDTRGAGTSS